MIYQIRHRTTYDYDNLVTFTRCVLRLTPQSSPDQTVYENRIIVTPVASQSRLGTGPFGEDTVSLVIETPHTELVVDAVSRVGVHRAAPPPAKDSPAWEAVRDAGFLAKSLGGESPATFLYPTRRAPIVADITEYGRGSFSAGRPVVEAVMELTTRIRADFIYDGDATEVSTGPGEAFAAKRGVCQDFTNIMIAALRGLGLPAAYVSGYLRTTPPPGKPRLEGADATHAWVLAWCGEAYGWIGFDPTNALLVQDDHIALAVGRDYADVAPFDGIMLASGAQLLKVEVDVIPEEEPAVVRPQFGTAVRGA